MKPTRVTPTGVERTFREDEIIVTKTDIRGVMTYVNDVFLRVSALGESDAIGKPHNLIRHPDMPRAVFGLLWDTVKDGRELFAYVLNLAVDGAHYWVFAHVTPSYDAQDRIVGYHSSRRKPKPAAVTAAAKLYAQLRAEERRHASAPMALEAGRRMMEETLAGLGVTYDEFVWDLTNGPGR
ncbi:MAG: PAS domain-containing protein [Actinomycetota bacterium]|nr:PAS domain-containing protein [Actinomycetota bacterium]